MEENSQMVPSDDVKSGQDVLYKNDENKERGNWSGRFDFLLSMLGYSVGVGNVWRFSYLCYKNGGGVFFIPYLLTLAVVGIPMFFFEMSISQFSSLGTLHCWKCAPLFTGVGVGMVAVSFLATIYYNMIMSYSFIFLIASFTSYLPWTDCNNDWNTPNCSLKLPLVNCTTLNGTEFMNGTCYNDTDFLGLHDVVTFENVTGIQRVSPSEEYFNNEILAMSSGIEEFGGLQWKLVLALLASWTLVFFCIMKGIKSSGKVVYVTATFPYLILMVLLVRGILLEGSYTGILFYIQPKWEKLVDGKVWRDGVTQIFYSLGMGWGGLHALASYNKFHNNTLRDALVSSLGSAITSIFAGFVVFSFLGAMAHSMGVGIDKVVTSGPGLAFVVYPEAFTYMPCPTLWSILFFLMIITIGLDTQFVMLETFITCIMDELPSLRRRKSLVILVLCAVEFLMGLPFTSAAGMYIFQLVDLFIAWIGLPVIILLEAVVFSYVYGMDRFSKDIKVMLGHSPSVYFKVCVMIFVPLLIPFVLIYPFFHYTRFTYGDHYTYPIWAEALGWVLTLVPVFCIIIATCRTIALTEGESIQKKVKSLLKPTRDWGPHLPQHRKLVDYIDDFVVDPSTEKLPLSLI